MPVEIRELVIKAALEANSENVSPGSSQVNNNTSPVEDLIKSCVEKVLEIIKEKNER
jgi:hypothetical protein